MTESTLNHLTGFISIKEGFCGSSTFKSFSWVYFLDYFLLLDTKTFLCHSHLPVCHHLFQSPLLCQSESIVYLNAVEISWQFKVFAFTQSFWEARGVCIVSLVHTDAGKVHSLPGLAVFEDCKNCALLWTLAAHKGLPACPWSVSSAGLSLSQTALMREFLDFSLGEPSLHPPDFLESSLRCWKCLGPWGLHQAPCWRGLKIP